MGGVGKVLIMVGLSKKNKIIKKEDYLNCFRGSTNSWSILKLRIKLTCIVGDV